MLAVRIFLSNIIFVAMVGAFSINDLPKEIPDGGKLWVVLVAGSRGFFNYRHQADVCHAYQVVHNHGVPDENIIVMMYDDIAYNKENPMQGVIMNRPNGPNVYKGVPKDYTNSTVNPDNFVKILLGQATNQGSGKVLQTGPNDYVFVFFSDHGAVGLVAFPDEVLHATTFVSTLKQMHKEKRFKKMAIYIEACESGSMFKGLLPDNIDVFGTTASNSTKPSFACYYDEKIKTFLGDVYSVKWLEDSDKENLSKETLEQQFHRVKKETNTSTVCQFGDMSISKLKVGDFQGNKEPHSDFGILELIGGHHQVFDVVKPHDETIPPWEKGCGRKDSVAGPDVPRAILERRLASAEENSEEQNSIREQLTTLLKNRKSLTTNVIEIINQVTGNEEDTKKVLSSEMELTQYDCHKDVVEHFHEKCYNLGCNGFAMQEINHFATLCELGYHKDLIHSAIAKVCKFEPVCGIE